MTTRAQSSLFTLVLPIILIGVIGSLDYRLGFGFNLFPLYLVPLAIVAWQRRMAEIVSVSLLAGMVIILKVFLTKHLYAHLFFWYWDAVVKVTLLVLFGLGLGRIRQMHLLQQKQNIARITELNMSLQRQVERLTEANRENAEVSYTISHDLRAPIRHILGFVELLAARNRDLDPKSRHYLKVIAQSATKMGNQIDGLLAFSQLGRTELLLQRTDLDATVHRIVEQLSEREPGRAIAWEIAPLPDVVGDPDMLRMAFYNLIANAVKFTRSRPRATIAIGTVEDPAETVIYVKDNGVGFDMRYRNKLFGMFQRLHPGEGFEGTGIGLAHVRRIIERHGGRIWAEGSVDGGATFWLSLPRVAAGAPAPNRAGTSTTNARGRLSHGETKANRENNDASRREIV
ncbi:sensor histidine kinase [Geomesophilobacter sediminis]|uniref:histidine kinase n=1 Tax=Geomesophilobacter sediminis TaxID=2798584 RepID=A0A8J7JCV5_9BACT|nr:ATP-binding protein [Geomesophilobacter sediminis]MBJ6723099.1 hypothetical protein [Geomesophilobacter sediminis]